MFSLAAEGEVGGYCETGVWQKWLPVHHVFPWFLRDGVAQLQVCSSGSSAA